MTLNQFITALAATSYRDWKFNQYGALECNDVYGQDSVYGAVRFDDGPEYGFILNDDIEAADVAAAAANIDEHDPELRRRLVEAVGLASAWPRVEIEEQAERQATA